MSDIRLSEDDSVVGVSEIDLGGSLRLIVLSKDSLISISSVSPSEGVSPSRSLLAISNIGLSQHNSGVGISEVNLGGSLRLVVSDISIELGHNEVIVVAGIRPSERVGPSRGLLAIINIGLSEHHVGVMLSVIGSLEPLLLNLEVVDGVLEIVVLLHIDLDVLGLGFGVGLGLGFGLRLIESNVLLIGGVVGLEVSGGNSLGLGSLDVTSVVLSLKSSLGRGHEVNSSERVGHRVGVLVLVEGWGVNNSIRLGLDG